jgi:hypothetical protein
VVKERGRVDEKMKKKEAGGRESRIREAGVVRKGEEIKGERGPDADLRQHGLQVRERKC